MKRFIRLSGIVLMACLMMGGMNQCKTVETVVVPEGPIAAQLGKTKDEQIKGLAEQVRAEQKARELEQMQAALAAADFETILFAASHLNAGLPRNAIEEEAKLGKARSPAPNPTEVIKGKDRVIAILQNDVAAAKAAYGQAFDEAKQAKAEIAEKDKQISERDTELKKRADALVKLEKDKNAEIEQHRKDFQAALDKKDEEFANYKKAEAEKERRWLINGSRIAALGLIVAGAIALAVFKLLAVGGGLVGAGVLVGLISIGIETLTSQPWWPYLCGFVFIAVVGLIIYGIYRLWVKHRLDDKKTQAIQDMIDEATIKGDTKTVDELKAHLNYRLGDKTTYWGNQQAKSVVQLGLVDPKGEAALKGKS